MIDAFNYFSIVRISPDCGLSEKALLWRRSGAVMEHSATAEYDSLCWALTGKTETVD
jgi:hypothetical protein